MSAAADIPYQLRPNKFIDRELFIELLGLVLPNKGAAKYIYISMGGRHMIDHRAVYRKLGVSNLFSFDVNGRTVKRQLFNRPIDSAKCDELHSGSLAGALDSIFAQFPDATNLIVWLDYTSPHERLSQLQELIEVAKRLQPGDILRVTLNANLGTLDETQSKWKEDNYPSPKEYRLERLKAQLGSFVPTEIDGISESDFPAVLSSCVELALAKAQEQASHIQLRPVLLTTYRDGQRMLTVTCLVESDIGGDFPAGLRDWKFRPDNWNELTVIEAPDLSLREKMRIDDLLSRQPSDVATEIGFPLADTEEKGVDAIRSYQLLHRYYPAFHNMDV